MSKDSEYSSKLPTEEEIEEGRRSSLFVGVIIGALVIAVGIVAYLLFGKYFV